MISVTKAYKDATKKPLRQSYVTIKYGLYNKEAKQEISSFSSTGGVQPFSSSNNILNETKENVYNYISCEPDRVKLDNNFVFVQDKSRVNANQDAGYWNNALSDINGKLMPAPYFILKFNKPISFTPLTLYFQEVVKDFSIEYALNNKIIYTRNITNNTLLTVDTTDINDEEPINYFDTIRIRFVATQTPYRYVKLNEIDFGAYKTFKSSEIKEFNIIEEISLDDNTLPSNSFNATIIDKNGAYDILNPNNKVNKLKSGQELSVTHHLKVGNVFKEVVLGTFLLKKVSSENIKLKLECYDELYFMNSTYYGSKFYTNESAIKVFQDLFDYFNYSNKRYDFDPELENVYLTGYVPNVEFREALRLIAESSKAIIKKNRTGGIYIYRAKESEVYANFFGKSDYINEQIKENLYNNTIDVKIYSYDRIENDTLYSSTLNKGIYNISFSKYPLVYNEYKDNYNLLKSGDIGNYIINSINANGCQIEVTTDNTKVELKGNYYVETSTNERLKLEENIDVDESAITKIDNHLITKNNYSEIANWKLSKSNIAYELEYKTTPFIEAGDKCKIQTKYKDRNGNYITKDFVANKIEYDHTIMQRIKGE